MTDILTTINDQMKANDIPYEYGEWTSKVSYPYTVGTYDEADYRYEDGCTTGTFTLDMWSRTSSAELLALTDTLKEIYADKQIIDEDRCYLIRYGGASQVPSGEEGLYHGMMTL